MQVQIHKSLTDKILVAGVPREFAILNGTISAAIILGLQVLVWIPFALVVHLLAVALTKKDPDWFLVLRRSFRVKGFYEG